MTRSFLALGDSYTIGEGVDEAERWPVDLAKRLRSGGLLMDDPRIVARTGWTAGELEVAIAAERITGKWDLVSLLVGVNDQFRGYGVERYATAFAAVLASAGAFAKLPGRLIVLSIPDWGVTPFSVGRDAGAIAWEIDNFNAVARDMALKAGARFVDVTPTSRLAARDKSLLAPDGLHPSPAMYQMWVDQLLPIATDALSAS